MIKLLGKLFIKNPTNYADNSVREQYSVITGVVGIILNILCSVGKVIVGVVCGSIAIISDGINNMGDMLSSIVAIISAKLSNRKPDKEHPFGHGRYEYIASLVVSFLIMFMGVELIIESVKKLSATEVVETPAIIMVVLIASIVIKIYMFAYNSIYAKKINSMVLKATAMDSLYDSITTTVILLATLLGKHFNLPIIDGIAGICVALLICYGGFNLAKESIGTLLGLPPSKETIDGLSNIILSTEGILGLHDLMVHDYGPGRQFGSVHAEVDERGNIVEIHEMIDALEGRLYKETGIQMTIHMDPISISEETLKHKTIVEDAIKSIDQELKIHDFRMVNGENQINVIFDLVVPHKFRLDYDQLADEVSRVIKAKDSRYYVVCQIESEYA